MNLCCHPYVIAKSFEQAKEKAQAEANRTGKPYQITIFNTVTDGEENEWTKEVVLPQPQDECIH